MGPGTKGQRLEDEFQPLPPMLLVQTGDEHEIAGRGLSAGVGERRPGDGVRERHEPPRHPGPKGPMDVIGDGQYGIGTPEGESLEHFVDPLHGVEKRSGVLFEGGGVVGEKEGPLAAGPAGDIRQQRYRRVGIDDVGIDRADDPTELPGPQRAEGRVGVAGPPTEPDDVEPVLAAADAADTASSPWSPPSPPSARWPPVPERGGRCTARPHPRGAGSRARR